MEGLGETTGELIRFLAPRTVEAVLRSLPLEGKADQFQGGIFFPTTIKMGMEKAKSMVDGGTIAFWPQASAFCLFHSPAKTYSPVNPIGKITGSLEPLKKAGRGVIVKVEKVKP